MAEPSGVAWCAKFPGSRSVDDLAEPFRASVKAFLAALTNAGAQVAINATLRPPERAYLMHFAWEIARNDLSPSEVPPKDGVDIDWDHPDAEQAAEDMVEGYGMRAEAVLDGNHMKGLAIDMEVSWTGSIELVDAHGAAHTITSPHGNANPGLQAVGLTYGVQKLSVAIDEPHWSIDGH
jgi:hypothetical protein